jgi:electron transport complex protein RnfD
MTFDKKLTVSASPHLRNGVTTTGIMLDVIIALFPASAAAVILFGYRTLAVMAVTIASALLSEYITVKILKKPGTLSDLSAVVTGLILALNLPASIPLWMAAIGSVVAIVVVKQFFGGLGQNYVNPALMGRIVLFVSFPAAMSKWTNALAQGGVEAVTTATPLALLKDLGAGTSVSELTAAGSLPGLWQMFCGVRPGSMGEVCIAALLFGGLYLLVRKVISPAIPFAYIGTVALIMLIAGKGDLNFLAYEIMGGGLILGAFFMATDYATSPANTKGRIIFGIGCGIITSVIRLFANMPEGVSFSILLMNILVPHIERITAVKPFGTLKEPKKKKGEAK